MCFFQKKKQTASSDEFSDNHWSFMEGQDSLQSTLSRVTQIHSTPPPPPSSHHILTLRYISTSSVSLLSLGLTGKPLYQFLILKKFVHNKSDADQTWAQSVTGRRPTACDKGRATLIRCVSCSLSLRINILNCGGVSSLFFFQKAKASDARYRPQNKCRDAYRRPACRSIVNGKQ